LRNSGAFRLIQKQTVSDALLDYDVQMRDAVNYATSVESWNFVTPSITYSASIFDIDLVFKIRKSVQRYFSHPDSVSFPYPPRLITYDDRKIMEFINLQRFAQLTDEVKYYNSVEAFEKNRKLDSLIRKEYKLK
jgi:hypothetical protein